MKIDLSKAKKVEKITGFGASACWWSTALNNEKYKKEIAKLLYSKEGLNLNIFRYNVGGGYEKDKTRVSVPWRNIESFMNEDGTYNFSKDKNAVSFMDECLKLNNIDTLIFFANSPHYLFTHSNQSSGGLTEHFSNLRKDAYEQFAKYMLDIAEHFINEGYPVKYISPINEPQWKWGGDNVWQEGCHYEPEELRDCLHIFAKEIEKRHLNILLYAPESGSITDHTKEYWDFLSKDKLIMKYLGVFAYHSYGSDDNLHNKIEFGKWLKDNAKTVPTDMSEWCELPCKNDTKSIESTLKMIRIIGEDIILSRARSWTHWVACNEEEGATKKDKRCYSDGLLTAKSDFSSYYISMRYYALAHFSKYVKLGAVSLYTGYEESQKFSHFAFKNPSGEYVIIASNESNRVRTLEFDKKYDKIKVIRTNKDEQLKVGYEKNIVKIPPMSSATIILGD